MPGNPNEPEVVEPVSLKDLLPPSSQLSSAGELESGKQFWTDEELAKSTAHWIRHYLKAGWKYADGVLKKGNRAIKPSQQMASKSGQFDFNPLRDAFAVRLGYRFVSDNRYEVPGLGYADRNGQLVGDDECLECGGLPWFVKTKRGLSPNAPAWQWNHTYCHRCVTATEVEAERQRLEDENWKARMKAERRRK